MKIPAFPSPCPKRFRRVWSCTPASWRRESLLEEKPELKEALDGLLSVYEIIPDAQCCCSDRYRRGGADGRKYDRCHAGAAWMRLGPVHYFCQYESDPDCSGKFIFSKSDINFFHNYTGSVHGCLFTDSL